MDRWSVGRLLSVVSRYLRFELHTSRPELRQYLRREKSLLFRSYMRRWKSWIVSLVRPCFIVVSTRRFMLPSEVKSSCRMDSRSNEGKSAENSSGVEGRRLYSSMSCSYG